MLEKLQVHKNKIIIMIVALVGLFLTDYFLPQEITQCSSISMDSIGYKYSIAINLILFLPGLFGSVALFIYGFLYFASVDNDYTNKIFEKIMQHAIFLIILSWVLFLCLEYSRIRQDFFTMGLSSILIVTTGIVGFIISIIIYLILRGNNEKIRRIKVLMAYFILEVVLTFSAGAIFLFELNTKGLYCY